MDWATRVKIAVGAARGIAYLHEDLIIGEGANFAAYAFAPAVLVTPLGALSMIVSAVLAHFILKERLHIFGMVGCLLCLVGSVTLVLHAPLEKSIQSVKDVWYLATEPDDITQLDVDQQIHSFGAEKQLKDCVAEAILHQNSSCRGPLEPEEQRQGAELFVQIEGLN